MTEAPREQPDATAPEAARRHRLGVAFFIGGLTASLIILGVDGAMLSPPQPIDPASRLLPASLLALYGAALASMMFGVGLTWSWRRGPRVLFLSAALTVLTLCAPTLFRLSADLMEGPATRPAVLLAHYDCDSRSRHGVEAALTCVEIMWRRPSGRVARERFQLSDAAFEVSPEVEPGRCIGARMWGHSEVLVGFRRARRDECAEVFAEP